MSTSDSVRKPANWQMTAATLHCDYVDDSVTLMVGKDWTYQCAWFNRYKKVDDDNPKPRPGAAIKARLQKCVGPDCSYTIGYRDKLVKEEQQTQ